MYKSSRCTLRRTDHVTRARLVSRSRYPYVIATDKNDGFIIILSSYDERRAVKDNEKKNSAGEEASRLSHNTIILHDANRCVICRKKKHLYDIHTQNRTIYKGRLGLVGTRDKLTLRSVYVFMTKRKTEKLPQNISFITNIFL